MIWIILFVVIIAASFFLALRSMKNYQEIPEFSSDYDLFLVRNKHSLTLDLLSKLHHFAHKQATFFSLERLFKGNQNALLIYGPKSLLSSFYELNLLELEDYLADGLSSQTSPIDSQKKVSKDKSYAFAIEPKNNPKRKLIIKNGFLKMLDLSQKDYFFWQIVAHPQKEHGLYQVTLRGMVATGDVHKRVELTKKILAHITEHTGLLESQESEHKSSSSVYDSFKLRTLVPKEAASFIIDSEELAGLMAV